MRQSQPDTRSFSIERAKELGRNLAKSQLDEISLHKQVASLDHQIKEENYIPSYLRVEEVAMHRQKSKRMDYTGNQALHISENAGTELKST